MNASPELCVDEAMSSTSLDATFEFAQLNQIYADWSGEIGSKVSLVESVLAARSENDTTELLCSVSGYLVMLVENSQSETPLAAYRRAQAAITNILPALLVPDEISEEDLLDQLLCEAQAAIDNPQFTLAKVPTENATTVLASQSGNPPPGTSRQEQDAPVPANLTQEADDEEDVSISAPEGFTFEDIIWKSNTSDYAERARDEKRLAVIKLLLAQGAKPITIIQNNYARNIPVDYEFPGGVKVEFLPHWDNFYRVELAGLKLPESAAEINSDVEAAQLGREAFEQYISNCGRGYGKRISFGS
jgi:hypothetical protein